MNNNHKDKIQIKIYTLNITLNKVQSLKYYRKVKLNNFRTDEWLVCT